MKVTFDSARLNTKETELARGWLWGMVETLVELEEEPSRVRVARLLSAWVLGPCEGDAGLANVLMGMLWGELDPEDRRRLDVLEALWGAARESWA